MNNFNKYWKEFIKSIKWIDTGIKYKHKYKTYLKCNKCNKDFLIDRSNLKTAYLREYNKTNIFNYVYICQKCNGKICKQRGDGRHINSRGYIWLHKNLIEKKFYPMLVKSQSSIAEHRYIIAKSLNRCLNKNEHVHHINGNKSDNRLENLQLIDPATHCAITIMENKWLEIINNLKEENNKLKEIIKDFTED